MKYSDWMFAFVPAAAFGPEGDKNLRQFLMTDEEGKFTANTVTAAYTSLAQANLEPEAREEGIKRLRYAWRIANPGMPEDLLPEAFKGSQEEANAYWFAEMGDEGATFMVALMVPSETAGKLVVDGGEAADDLHLTLACYDASGWTEIDRARVIAAVDKEVRWYGPITGQVTGYGRFKGEEQDVYYASFNSFGLYDFRECVINTIACEGYWPHSQYDFTPHITLKYLAPDDANPTGEIPLEEVTFPSVSVVNDSDRVDIPFYATTRDNIMGYTDEQLQNSTRVRELFFSMTQDWIPYLPIPGLYHHTKYGMLELTPERYQRMVKNYKDQVFQQSLPITVEHDHGAAGAVGWVTDMRIAADGSIEVRPEWNERGRALIDGDRFRYVSAEFAFRWQDPVSGVWFSDVAVGHTICIRPHFKADVLQPLAASEDAALAEYRQTLQSAAEGVIVMAEEAEEKEEEMDDEENTEGQTQANATDAAATAAAKPAAAAPTTITMSDTSPSGLVGTVLAAEERQTYERRIKLADERVTLAERRAEQAEGQLAKLQSDRRREWALAEVLGRSEHNGSRWLGDVERHVTHLVSLAEQFGQDSTEVNYLVQEQRAKRQAMERSGMFREISAGGGSEIMSDGTSLKEAELQAAQLRESDPSLSKEASLSLVFSQHPELYDRYIES